MGGDRLTAEEIFNAAREKANPGERTAYLDGACGKDLGLRAKVEALLEADLEAESFFESARRRVRVEVADVTEDARSPTAPAPLPGERAGESIGRYKLLQSIGEGGFGSVWMAEQREPVRRQVALKIIKLGMDTREVIARFEAERQALAMMDHPNICKVLDAGSTDGGRPYFVMELVRGVPITEYCDTESLSSRRRLELFIQVCKAVQHAHQKGIIHRDLKPSNVMVTLHDGVPVPKVIDFGIAKATHRELTEKTLFTEYRQFIGTPEYMSPEQAEMSGLDIDTRSDIYSLGVLLYELLTGVTPFDPRMLRAAALNEIRRIIREEDPPKPSTRLSGLHSPSEATAVPDGGDARRTTLQAIARNRSTDAPSLMRSLRGDLDWIVMKALEKERARRYETANGLAMDIQRHLDNEPVTASPPSPAYRLKKFLARNRASMAAAALVFLVLLLGVIGTTYGLLRALDAEQLAREEEKEATRQAEIAESVNAFLNEDLLAAVAPSAEAGRGRDAKMLDVLNVAAERIERASAPGGRLADKPLVEASIRSTIGRTYVALGAYRLAKPHLERALDLRLRHLDDDHPEALSSRLELAEWHRAQRLHVPAFRLYTPVLEAIRRAPVGDRRWTSLATLAFAGVAHLYKERRQWPRAEEVLKEAREFLTDAPGEELAHRARIGSELADLYLHQRRWRRAEAEFREALRLRQKAFPAGDPTTLHVKIRLAQIYRDEAASAPPGAREDGLERARKTYSEALSPMRDMLGESHPKTIYCTLGLAKTHALAGEFEDAQRLLRESIEKLRDTLEESDHPGILKLQHGLAEIYGMKGEQDLANELFEKTIRSERQRLGPAHPETIRTIETWSDFLVRAGLHDEASRLVEEVLAIAQDEFEEYPDSLSHMNHMGILFRHNDLDGEAETLFQRLIEIGRRIHGPKDRLVLGTSVNLGGLYNTMERFDDALETLEATHSIMREHYGIEDPWTRNAASALATAYEGSGRRSEALPLRRDLLEFHLEVCAGETGASAATFNDAAWSLLTDEFEELRDPERALPLARRACQREEESGGANLWLYLDTLALALHRTGNTEQAIETQKRALSLAPEGTDDTEIEEMTTMLEEFRAALAKRRTPEAADR